MIVASQHLQVNLPSDAGNVYLVGAGPGDPGLITLRGAECLRKADLVLYDYLVNPRVLAHARRSAERVCLGRHGQGRIMPPQEVHERMIAAARQGRSVVRLKSGDPAIFARGAQEVEALTTAGVPFEIVPGVTAALAAGSYAGIPVTHRDFASAVAFVTGQEAEGGSPPDFAALARFPGTLMFYMGVTTARQWTGELMRHGLPASTPAAIIRRCSWPDQLVVRCELSSIADEMESRRLRPPVIVAVGAVAGLPEAKTWFERRPLFGQTVLVTRPEHQAESLRGPLEELGAAVLVQPAIEIGPPADWGPVDEALAGLERFDWIVFSSANGVRFFLERLLATGRDLRHLGGLRLAAIGPATADELASFHLRADLLPHEFRAEDLARVLTDETLGTSGTSGATGGLSASALPFTNAGKQVAPDTQAARFLLIRASRGREVLAESLRAAGGIVTQVVAYESRDVERPDPAIAAALAAGEIDCITITSSAIARSLARMFGDDLKRARLASISPITSQTLRDLGFQPAVEAREYTMRGVVEAVLVES